MKNLLLVYILCRDRKEADFIGKRLLEKRLVACINTIDSVKSQYFWPPKTGKIEKGIECLLLVKTVRGRFPLIEQEVKAMHSYEVPCIIGIPIIACNPSYAAWICDEVK